MIKDCPICQGSGESMNGSPCSNGCAPVTPGSYMSDRIEESHEAELVRYVCPACKDEIVQDAEDTLIVDLDANPVCSTDCQAKANHEVEVRRELEKVQEEYAELDALDETYKEWSKKRAAAHARIVELAGVGHHFEASTGVRYITDTRKGAWIDFTPYEMKHSKRFDTDKHTFTVERQEELGYEVDRKRKAKIKAGE
jgi:hypothetical protein